MSTFDHILLADDRSPADLARVVAAHTPLSVAGEADGIVFLTRPAVRPPGDLIVEVRANYFITSDPSEDELSFVDLLPTLLTVRRIPRDRDQMYSAAVNIFLELTAFLPTTMLLLRELDILVAVFTPAEGIFWMPPGTTPDARDRERWLPYVPGRSS